MTDQPASSTYHDVVPRDRELYLELGLAEGQNSEDILAGSFDKSAPLQMIAGYRKKQDILSTITALSNALAANPSPPAPEMQILVARALGELQSFIVDPKDIGNLAAGTGIASGSRLESAGS